MGPPRPADTRGHHSGGGHGRSGAATGEGLSWKAGCSSSGRVLLQILEHSLENPPAPLLSGLHAPTPGVAYPVVRWAPAARPSAAWGSYSRWVPDKGQATPRPN